MPTDPTTPPPAAETPTHTPGMLTTEGELLFGLNDDDTGICLDNPADARRLSAPSCRTSSTTRGRLSRDESFPEATLGGAISPEAPRHRETRTTMTLLLTLLALALLVAVVQSRRVHRHKRKLARRDERIGDLITRCHDLEVVLAKTERLVADLVHVAVSTPCATGRGFEALYGNFGRN